MTISPEGNANLAVLIDADNADAAIIEPMLKEIATIGVASVKRIYGDWTNTQLNKWKQTLLAYSIQPMQQFAYTTGKNATDSAMIIDAMDLLYTGTFDGFCIVSSDSDFTRLASRIRESGKRVYGFGEDKTPRPFVTACDQFIYTDVFRGPALQEGSPAPARKERAELRKDTALVRQLRSAIEAAAGENGRAALGRIGSILVKQAPDFDPRRHGYAKLSDLIEASGLFPVERSSGGWVLTEPAASPAKPAKKAAAKAAATKKVSPKPNGAKEAVPKNARKSGATPQ